MKKHIVGGNGISYTLEDYPDLKLTEETDYPIDREV